MDASLYERDFALWSEKQAQYLAQRELAAIDWDNIQEEIAALGRSEKYALESRLEVLLKHLLKRCYVNSPYDHRGWELTIKEQRKQIRRLLRVSPSLKTYFDKILPEAWQDALSDVCDRYPDIPFPPTNPFPTDSEHLLSELFWN
jgi:hypothetical protein